MSYHKPIVPQFTGMKNIDSVVEGLQEGISQLSWLTYSFGLADRFVEQGEAGPYVYPATFMEGIEHFDCLPNDNAPAFSFWRVVDPVLFIYDDEDAFERWPVVETTIDVIVFANLAKTTSSTNYHTTRSAYRQQLINILTNNMLGDFKLIPESMFENDITQVYEGYSINQVDNVKKQLPYWAVRVRCTLKYLSECESSS